MVAAAAAAVSWVSFSVVPQPTSGGDRRGFASLTRSSLSSSSCYSTLLTKQKKKEDHFPFVYCVENSVYEGRRKEWISCFDKLGLDPKPFLIASPMAMLLHYKEGTADRRYNLIEALLFLSHFMGDIHQPMHIGFTTDEGGNTIDLRWYRHKSNLHHVWDREIILTALKDFYENDMSVLQEAIEGNFTDGMWQDDIMAWKECDDLLSCSNKYAVESLNIACKWGYKGVKKGATLAGLTLSVPGDLAISVCTSDTVSWKNEK